MSEIVVIGSLVTDLKFYTERLPKQGETVVGELVTGLGGKGYNQAVTCAKLGIPTTFIGQIGEDAQGEEFYQAAQTYGLDCKLSVDPNVATGSASIVVDKLGHNQLVVSLGANKTLEPRFVLKQLETLVSPPKIIIMQLETNPEVITAVLQYVRSFLGKRQKLRPKVILNPAPMNNFLPYWLEGIDYITPNETECEVLDKQFPDEINPVTKLNKGPLSNVTQVITQGMRGASFRLPMETLWESVPNIQVAVKDTTGAGDCFNGGLAVGLLRYGFDIRKATRFANVVAGLSVQREGTSESAPTLKEVENYLKETQL